MQVAGYFQGVMGTGEHARQIVAALGTQGIRPSLATIHPDGSPEDKSLALGTDEDARDPFGGHFSLLCVNADMVPQTARQLGRRFFAGRYLIGFWAWEVSVFPARFATAFEHIDEVWVGSEHVRSAVSEVATRPVVRIPQPVSLPDRRGDLETQAPSGLPEGFRFVFAFDYLSVFERKNPLAAIEAFRRAFPVGSGAVLILKSLNDDYNPEAHGRLRAAIAGHGDIHLIERRLTASERDGLMGVADCYVSMHRAEGFGYTLAEAMWLGKPVIATGYSGNIDFMTTDNSYLIRYRLVPVGPGRDPYPAEAEWAEPDVEHAARLMREVFEHPDDARARGARAAADIRRTHGPEAAGRAMRDRLEQLAESHRWRSPRKRLQRLVATVAALPRSR